MNLQQAKSLAESEMEKHGLTEGGWQFQWSASNHDHGQCFHNTKTIVLSTRLTSVNEPETVRDTIWHEMAHAIGRQRPQA